MGDNENTRVVGGKAEYYYHGSEDVGRYLDFLLFLCSSNYIGGFDGSRRIRWSEDSGDRSAFCWRMRTSLRLGATLLAHEEK